MDNIIVRFPFACEAILRQLDAQSLVFCREVSRKWKNFTDGKKTVPIRIITKYIAQWENAVQLVKIEF